PTAHQMGDGILDHHFGGAGAGVVVGTHHEAVGAGRAYRQQIALGQGQFPVLAEEVAGLAYRAEIGSGAGREWILDQKSCEAEDGIRDFHVTGVQTCALPISRRRTRWVTESSTITSAARGREL